MTPDSVKVNPAGCCRRVKVDGHEQVIFEVGSVPGAAGPRITLQDNPPTVVVEDGNGNSITLNPSGITINAVSRVSVNASIVDVSANTVSVNSPTTTFDGIVQAETLIAQQVLNSNGNIW